MEFQNGKSFGFRTNASGPEEGKRSLYSGSYYYALYDERHKAVLQETLEKETSVLPPFSVFDGNDCVQYAGTE